MRLCKEEGGGSEVARLHVEQSGAETGYPPTTANVQMREGSDPVVACSPIPLRQLSHGTETPSARWKVKPEQFGEEVLAGGHKLHSVDTIST